jgi:hypothetical protein
MRSINHTEDPSPLFLASFGKFESIKWEKLEVKDITECDDRGRTLLYHCAKEGLWDKLPERLRDQKYWQPTFDNTTILMCAVQSGNAKWIKDYPITKENLLEQNKIGESMLSLAILSENLDAIPEELITKDLLKETLHNKERYIHFISRNKKIKLIEWEMLDEELLGIQDSRGNSSYHLLAENETLRLIPRHLLTLDKILTENNQGISPLDSLVHEEDPSELLKNELLTEEIFFKEKENIEAPIHPWVNGQAWANIPKKFITSKNLTSKGSVTLLKSILSQYARQAVWYTKNDDNLKKMTELVKLSVKFGDKKEIQEILKELETLEKGDTYPNGIKKASTLISEELTKKKILKEVTDNKRFLEI